MAGDARQVLQLFQELLPDQQGVLGADHPDTLKTRADIAVWTGRTGAARQAVRSSQELLHDHQRVLGADHPDRHPQVIGSIQADALTPRRCSAPA